MWCWTTKKISLYMILKERKILIWMQHWIIYLGYQLFPCTTWIQPFDMQIYRKCHEVWRDVAEFVRMLCGWCKRFIHFVPCSFCFESRRCIANHTEQPLILLIGECLMSLLAPSHTSLQYSVSVSSVSWRSQVVVKLFSLCFIVTLFGHLEMETSIINTL